MKTFCCILWFVLHHSIMFGQHTDNPHPEQEVVFKQLRADFDILAEQWRTAYNSKDAKNFVPLYGDHAQYLSAHVPGYVAHGREAILANFQRGMNQGGFIDSIRIQSIEISCDLATVVSSYFASNSGKQVQGRNLLVSKYINDRWEIIFHMTIVKD